MLLPNYFEGGGGCKKAEHTRPRPTKSFRWLNILSGDCYDFLFWGDTWPLSVKPRFKKYIHMCFDFTETKRYATPARVVSTKICAESSLMCQKRQVSFSGKWFPKTDLHEPGTESSTFGFWGPEAKPPHYPSLEKWFPEDSLCTKNRWWVSQCPQGLCPQPK